MNGRQSVEQRAVQIPDTGAKARLSIRKVCSAEFLAGQVLGSSHRGVRADCRGAAEKTGCELYVRVERGKSLQRAGYSHGESVCAGAGAQRRTEIERCQNPQNKNAFHESIKQSA